MTGLRVYRELLQNGPLVRLLIGEAISGIGDWLYIVAIFVVIYEQSGSAALVGAFGAIRLIPYVVLSVPAGFVADRFDRRLVLLWSDVYRATLQILMAILVASNGPVVVIAGLAIAATCGSAFFYPAIGAYIPALAKDETQLGPANSVWATIQNFSYIVGPAIGGIVLALGNVTSAFILNALSFVAIVVILWFLPPSRGSAPARPGVDAPSNTGSETEASGDVPATVDPTASGAAVAAGPRPLQRRPLAGLGVIQVIAGFLGGGYQVITVVLALDVLHAGDAGNGYLNAAIGIGGLVGGFVAGALVLRRGLGLPLSIGALVSGAGTLGLGLMTNLGPALVVIGVASAGAIIIDVVTTTVFQRLVPDELRGRGVGVLMAVTTLTGAAGALLLPIGVSSIGPGVAFGALGVATVVATLSGLVLIGTAADRAPTLYEATMERVARLPLFAGVTRARLETAMRRVVELPVAAGMAVVTQGEAADRFYIIESGAFTVTQVPPEGGPPRVLRKLGENQVFGELGLLRREPRSATVTADSDGLLLVLERDDFLELVGVGELRSRMIGLYSGYGGTS